MESLRANSIKPILSLSSFNHSFPNIYMMRIFILILGIIFFSIGAGFIYFKAWPDYQKGKKSMNWPRVTGTVLHSEVVRSRSASTGRKRGGGDKISYRADISYSYIVDGHQFQSSQIYMGSAGVSTGSKEAYQYINKYPVGKTVTVYYSPQDKSNTVLEPGVNKSHYIFLGFGVVFAFVGLMFMLYGLFAVLFLTLQAGVIFGSLFGSKKKRLHRSSSLQNRGGRRPVSSYAKTSFGDRADINLDNEMARLNRVSSTSLPEYDEPWNYDWIIEISNKKYGPYSFDKVVSYFRRGKVKRNYNCYPASGGKALQIKDIVHRRAG